jgi:hypothetical protein
LLNNLYFCTKIRKWEKKHLKEYRLPISWADQKVTGGLGIMLDDIIAGLWAALCIFIILFYFLT